VKDRSLYLVWSNERMAWWRQNRHGYEKEISQAGRWTREQALAMCFRGAPGTGQKLGYLPDLPVREIDVHGLCELINAQYPTMRKPWE
jgi:hypothetical protein